MIGDDTVRMRTHNGADEANVAGTAYHIHSDGAFYVDKDAAGQLEHDGRSGFFRASPTEFHPPEGSVTLAEVEALIFGLEPGPIRAGLIAALSQLGVITDQQGRDK
jgi:hypothetical protein